MAKTHGTPRRTVLVGGDLKALVTARSASLEVADDPVDVLLSSAGLLARTPVSPDGEPGRPSREAAPARRDGEHGRATARGQVGPRDQRGAGAAGRRARPARRARRDHGRAVAARRGAGDASSSGSSGASGCWRSRTYDPASTGLALATRLGTVKRVAPDWPARLDAVEVVALRPGDEVVGAVELADGEEELVFFTSTGDLLRFPASAVRPQGRTAGGMAGVKLAAGARSSASRRCG